MIFGQPPPGMRLPFTRPPAASFYTPRIPSTAYYSHISPFMNVMAPMRAFMAQIPQLPVDIHPGHIRKIEPGSTGIRQQLPVTVAPPAAVPMPQTPTPAPTAGFFGAGGSPYNVMRSGAWPGIRSSGGNIRAGYMTAGQRIRALSPAGFPGANVPAGTYAPGAPGT